MTSAIDGADLASKFWGSRTWGPHNNYVRLLTDLRRVAD